MTVLRFNSIFTPSLFLVVKLIQMAMFPHRYPDTIKLYVVPNLTMFRGRLIKLQMVVKLFLIKESREKNWASEKWNRSLKGKLQFAYQKWKQEAGSLVWKAILLCLFIFRELVQTVQKASLPPFFRQTSVLVVENRIIDVIDQIATGPKFCKVWNSFFPSDVSFSCRELNDWRYRSNCNGTEILQSVKLSRHLLL